MKSITFYAVILFFYSSLIWSQKITGKVFNQENQLTIEDATVFKYNSKGLEIGTATINNDGVFEFALNNREFYRLEVQAPGYNSAEVIVGKLLNNADIVINFGLDILTNSAEIESNKKEYLLDNLFLEPVYFDFNQDTIAIEQQSKLLKAVEILKDHLQLKVAVKSHTDSRGSTDYNQKLSERRAKSTVDFLVNRGIAKERIVAKGFGETKLANSCDDDAKCSDEAHKKNRRSELQLYK